MASTDEKIFNGLDLETYSTLIKQAIQSVRLKLPMIVLFTLIRTLGDIVDFTCNTSVSDIIAAANAEIIVIGHVLENLSSTYNNSYIPLLGVVDNDYVVFSSIFADISLVILPTDILEGGVTIWKGQRISLQGYIPDLATIRGGAAAGATAYQKPSTGIPKSDLEQSVQTSLGKADTALLQHQDLSSYADGAEYDSTNHLIYLKHGNTRLANPINANDFIKDGMVDTVTVTGGNLVITFNTDSGKLPITIPISDIFDANNYYNKTESDARYLLSFTETDPIYSASVAAGITSSDISNWNSKTSNVGTITGITMNGTSKGTSGVVNLGTVVTSETDPVFTASAAHSITLSDITNWNNKLDSYTETDPTVPSWAKLSTKPSYDYSEINNTPSLATVATSGSYNDLSNKPTIPIVPTNVSAFTNDAGYLTTHLDISGKQDVLTPGDGIAIDNTDTIRTTGIPYGECDSTSTATAFTATVPGIYKLEDGVCCIVKNGVVTSASGFTLNINGLGAKPSYNNMTTGNDVTPTAPTRDTTIFNINYAMLFIYSETIVNGGGWICYRGYDANTNTIGYQVRSNSMSLPASQKFYRYRLLFTSADGTHYVPANTSSSTNATASRTVNQTPIDPFGHIVYYGYTTAIEANARPGAGYLWIIYTLSLGYSFNRTGAALTLDDWAPVYIKCAPQADGSAIIDADTPYVQALPTTADGKIYIFLGVAYNTTSIELLNNHPVYYHDGTGIRLWTGKDCYNKTLIDTKLEDKQDVISIVDASATIPSELESNTFYDFGTISTNILIPNLATPDDSSIVNIYAFCMTIDDTLTQAPSITLPLGVDLADELDINPGDYVEFSIMDNKAIAKVWSAS